MLKIILRHGNFRQMKEISGRRRFNVLLVSSCVDNKLTILSLLKVSSNEHR